ncbi:nucleotidyl transferase AbiEii/AbiGii toxin family protein [Coraliomargarita sp. W4R53]
MDQVTSQLDAAGIRYALIGGFAMALRGVQRATIDMDFILMLDDLEEADTIFQTAGYVCAFKSQNVSHYMAKDSELGRINLLHAFRGPTLSMLDRAERISVTEGLTLPVVQVEDIIGLKVQAVVNSPKRATADWADIQMILETSGERKLAIDWELLDDYLGLFELNEKLTTLQKWYGPSK